MAYEIYLNDVRFPVAPSSVRTKIKNKNKTIDLINDGEVNQLKDAGLTEFDFKLLLPNFQYPFAVYDDGVFHKAAYYLEILEKLKTSKEPFQFMLNRMLPSGEFLFKTNIRVSLEDYEIDDETTNGFDIEVNIKLLQYREYGVKTVDVSSKKKTKSKKKGKKKRSSTKKEKNSGTTYTIKSGDTLWAIAKSKLGDGSKYKSIYEANKSVLDKEAKKHGKASSSNGHWIWAGTKITIP